MLKHCNLWAKYLIVLLKIGEEIRSNLLQAPKFSKEIGALR